MTGKRYLKLLWYLAVIFTSVMAMTFLFMPIAADFNNPNRSEFMLATGIVFWSSFLIGYASWMIAIVASRKDRKEKQRFKFGIFCNAPTAFFDMTFCVALICIVVSVLLKKTQDYSIYICIFLLILSLNMHGLFSGNLYRTQIKSQRREG